MKKLLLILISFLLLGACAQSTAFIGPAITVGSSGNVMQSGFSYGSNLAVKKATGKAQSEHVSSSLKEKNDEKKLIKQEEEIRKEMVSYLKSHIEIIRNKLTLKK